MRLACEQLGSLGKRIVNVIGQRGRVCGCASLSRRHGRRMCRKHTRLGDMMVIMRNPVLSVPKVSKLAQETQIPH